MIIKFDKTQRFFVVLLRYLSCLLKGLCVSRFLVWLQVLKKFIYCISKVSSRVSLPKIQVKKALYTKVNANS